MKPARARKVAATTRITVSPRSSCAPRKAIPFATLAATKNDAMRRVTRSDGRKEKTAYTEAARRAQGRSCTRRGHRAPARGGLRQQVSRGGDYGYREHGLRDERGEDQGVVDQGLFRGVPGDEGRPRFLWVGQGYEPPFLLSSSTCTTSLGKRSSGPTSRTGMPSASAWFRSLLRVFSSWEVRMA